MNEVSCKVLPEYIQKVARTSLYYQHSFFVLHILPDAGKGIASRQDLEANGCNVSIDIALRLQES